MTNISVGKVCSQQDLQMRMSDRTKNLVDVLLPNLDRVLVERIDIKSIRTVTEDIGNLILSNLN